MRCQYLVEAGNQRWLEVSQELVDLMHVQSEVPLGLNWFGIVGIWRRRFWLTEAGLRDRESANRLAGDGQRDVAFGSHLGCEVEEYILLMKLESNFGTICRLHEELNLHIAVKHHRAIVLLDSEIPNALNGVVQFYCSLLAVVRHEAATLWLLLLPLWLLLDDDVVESCCRQRSGRVVGVALGDRGLHRAASEETDCHRCQTDLMQK